MNLAVVCAATDMNHAGLLKLRTSAHRHGLECHIVNLGPEWKGFGMKLGGRLIACDTVPAEVTHFLWLDAYDTLVLADADEIMAKYFAFQHPWVISAEENCWPDKERAGVYTRRFGTERGRWGHLNSGAGLVAREYLEAKLKAWGVTEETIGDSDQRFLTDKLLSEDALKMDNQCSLFQSLCGVKPKEFLVCRRRVVNETTNQMPCVLHGNGRGDMTRYYEIAEGA